uniref:Uncharacterized protein n=1 Tax=Oryza brachyantha TaxID=4533 RepID=J3MY61_ORYBR
MRICPAHAESLHSNDLLARSSAIGMMNKLADEKGSSPPSDPWLLQSSVSLQRTNTLHCVLLLQSLELPWPPRSYRFLHTFWRHFSRKWLRMHELFRR